MTLIKETYRWVQQLGFQRPALVFATGGYVSGPVLLAALCASTRGFA
ncbi:MAG: hypothetical protein U0003_03835 [Vampirovibrionales bacterium]